MNCFLYRAWSGLRRLAADGTSARSVDAPPCRRRLNVFCFAVWGILLLHANPAAGADAQLEANPLYAKLLDRGVEVSPGESVPLPKPTVADRVDGATLRAKIEAIPDRHMSVDELLRKSIVSPLVFGLRQVETKDKQLTVTGVDVWFVAYGDLQTLSKEDFLDDLVRREQKDAKIRALKPAELADRKISPVDPASQDERYVHSAFPVLDKVQVTATSRVLMTHTEDSLVVAMALDPRFAGDKDFPNTWRTMKTAGGKTELGPQQPYTGAAAYLKVTRLSDPAGGLFIEYHLVFVEPKEWFGGTSQLRSKLPVLIQSEVRALRRQLSEG
jgi:hypothetical protein